MVDPVTAIHDDEGRGALLGRQRDFRGAIRRTIAIPARRRSPLGVRFRHAATTNAGNMERNDMPNYRKTPEAVARLTPEQYRVSQQNGTEAPGTGELLDNHEPGIYVDIVSGETLFGPSASVQGAAGRG